MERNGNRLGDRLFWKGLGVGCLLHAAGGSSRPTPTPAPSSSSASPPAPSPAPAPAVAPAPPPPPPAPEPDLSALRLATIFRYGPVISIDGSVSLLLGASPFLPPADWWVISTPCRQLISSAI